MYLRRSFDIRDARSLTTSSNVVSYGKPRENKINVPWAGRRLGNLHDFINPHKTWTLFVQTNLIRNIQDSFSNIIGFAKSSQIYFPCMRSGNNLLEWRYEHFSCKLKYRGYCQFARIEHSKKKIARFHFSAHFIKISHHDRKMNRIPKNPEISVKTNETRWNFPTALKIRPTN